MSTTETKVKERPILFSGSMVRAILEGRKTQTRRIVKPKHDFVIDDSEDGTNRVYYPCYVTGEPEPEEVPCPYGRVGERLWVRETHCKYGGKWIFRADYPGNLTPISDGIGGPWKPSIHMPRLASRIALEITGARVERLNDISEADAQAEGIHNFGGGLGLFGYDPKGTPGPMVGGSATEAFALLWESINGPGSWALNPWVWVVEFKRISSL